VDAVLRRDAEEAANMMRKHLENIQSSLCENLAQESAQAISSGGQHVADHDLG